MQSIEGVSSSKEVWGIQTLQKLFYYKFLMKAKHYFEERCSGGRGFALGSVARLSSTASLVNRGMWVVEKMI